MSHRPTLFHRLGLLAIAAALPGCSLAYDLNLDQCTVDADCASIGQGLICGTDNICKVDDRGCADNAQCIDENQAESVCIRQQPDDLRGECVNLKTEQCPTILPLEPQNFALETLRNDDPLILGVFTALTLSPYLYNYDLAMTQVEQVNDGLSTQGGTRKVLMLACNGNRPDAPIPANFDQDLDAAMDHLIKLKVPGVASGLEASDLKRVFEQKGHPANMFFMSSQEADRALPVQDDDLLWQILPGGSALGRSYRPIVDRTLAFLQDSGALTGPARIAQINTPDIRLLGDMATAIQDDSTGIYFNGKTAVQNQTPDNNYLALTTPSTSADDGADLSEQVEQLLTFKPHVIISLGTREFLDTILPQLESQWSLRAPGQARPFYMLSPYQYGARDALGDMLQQYPSVRQRMLGVNAPASGDPNLYGQYISKFRTAYPRVPRPDGYENFYDSAYYLLYAAAAARPAPTDGLSLAAGMLRLLSGPSFAVGPEQMPDAFNELRSSNAASITLEGLMGPPKFDARGGRDDAGAVWCIDIGGNYLADVLTYNEADGTMQGSFPCFANF